MLISSKNIPGVSIHCENMSQYIQFELIQQNTSSSCGPSGLSTCHADIHASIFIMTRVVWISICVILQEGQRQNQPLPHHMRCIKIIGSTQLSCDPCTGDLTSCLKTNP